MPRYEVTVKAGAWFADESDPLGHRTANIATDVTVPIWVRDKDGEVLERLLASWNEVAVRRSDAEEGACSACGYVKGELRRFTLGSKWRWFWRGFFGFFWPPLLRDCPHMFTRDFWR